ncbi:MAG TPA: hypothetical protein VFT22_42465 [Kofleriaceae bacterium]|nr:hypothetical protein [Kofleriaceae bacterium]
MTEDDDLRINRLHRFAKHSPRLVLHEYSHCEVPAGCGGVVLRWTDPAQGVPVSIALTTLKGTGKTWLDGSPLASSRTLLTAGWHVLAFHLRRDDPSRLWFSIGALPDADPDRDLIHQGTPVYRQAALAPADGWTAPGFDDTGWSAPVLVGPEIGVPADPWERMALDRARRCGQPVFAFSERALWVRVTFAVAEAP